MLVFCFFCWSGSLQDTCAGLLGAPATQLDLFKHALCRTSWSVNGCLKKTQLINWYYQLYNMQWGIYEDCKVLSLRCPCRILEKYLKILQESYKDSHQGLKWNTPFLSYCQNILKCESCILLEAMFWTVVSVIECWWIFWNTSPQSKE